MGILQTERKVDNQIEEFKYGLNYFVYFQVVVAFHYLTQDYNVIVGKRDYIVRRYLHE